MAVPTALVQAEFIVVSRLVASGAIDCPMVVAQVVVAARVFCCASVPHV